MWSLWTNQRPVSRSHDHSRAIRNSREPASTKHIVLNFGLIVGWGPWCTHKELTCFWHFPPFLQHFMGWIKFLTDYLWGFIIWNVSTIFECLHVLRLCLNIAKSPHYLVEIVDWKIGLKAIKVVAIVCFKFSPGRNCISVVILFTPR